MDNLPAGAKNDPEAPFNQQEIIYVCSNCYEQTDIEVDEYFHCPECSEESISTDMREIEERQKEDHYEYLMERMKDDGF